jgi:transposase
MSKKRVYFPRTTSQQRELLFETWEATGDVKLACQRAHVSERTFYKWKERFKEGGYEALRATRSHAPHQPRRVATGVAEQVVALKEANPKWGKRRIADEMSRANNWVPLVSHNTVKRILQAVGLWTRAEPSQQKGGQRDKAVALTNRGKQ